MSKNVVPLSNDNQRSAMNDAEIGKRVKTGRADGWHPSRVKRTRIRVIEVNFSAFLIKGKEF